MKNVIMLLVTADATVQQFNSIDGVDGAAMPLIAVFPKERAGDWRKILDRAMNTWEPQDQPQWLAAFSAEVDRMMERPA